jgi:hypothetical protein
VNFVEETLLNVKLSHSLDCYQTQRWLCSASGANPQIAEWNYDSSYQLRCRWRNASRSAQSHWEIHRVLCPLKNHYVLTTGIRILHKIYTFVETQQKGNKVRSFFRQGEISTLLQDCQAGLQQSFDFFQVCFKFHLAAIHSHIIHRLKDPGLCQILQRCRKMEKKGTKKCSIWLRKCLKKLLQKEHPQ